MEKAFIQTKYKGEIDLPKELIQELPQKVMLASTIQFVQNLPEIKRKLVAYKKEVYLFNSLHGRYPGQILGCDTLKVKSEIEGFLYVGDGQFHPRALLVNEKPVFYYNPFSEMSEISQKGKFLSTKNHPKSGSLEWGKLGRAEWEEYKLKKKVALMKFHSANNIGILISTKEGQKNIQGKADQLKTKLEQEGKSVYLFIGNEVKDLENFNFIDCWVNTACPRISDDFDKVINLRDLL